MSGKQTTQLRLQLFYIRFEIFAQLAPRRTHLNHRQLASGIRSGIIRQATASSSSLVRPLFTFTLNII